MKKHYINAVVALLREGRDLDVVLQNLSSLLVQKGHTRLHKSVLEGVCARMLEDQELETPLVRLAKAQDEKDLEAQIKQALGSLGYTNKQVRTHIDPTIIGGFIATYRSKRINASYKEKLVSLYRNITA